jgi:hypothetical protein
MPFWGWRIIATWQNGKLLTSQCDYERCDDAYVHREIYLALALWLDKDVITREEKIALMHIIRGQLKMPDIRNRPTRLPYVEPEE